MKQSLLLLLISAPLLICSCSSDEEKYGDWEPMEWVASGNITMEEGYFVVEPEAETVHFTCKNYTAPWIAQVQYSTGSIITKDDDTHRLQTDWFDANMSGNKLTVAFEKNNTDADRVVSFIVTAGDIFTNLPIKQKHRIMPIDKK